MLARSSAPSSSGRCSTLLLAITQRVRVHGAVQKRCITTCAIESNVDAASALLSIPLAQISSSSEVFNNLPLVCTVPGVESDLDLGNTFVALFFALTGLLPISWYIFAWQANKQSSQAGNAGRSALQERTKREEIETELRTAEQRRSAAEAGLKTAAAAFEARVVALTSSNDKAIAALKAKEAQLADLEKQLMVARARSGEVQRRQPSLKPGPTAAAAAIPARAPVSKLRAAAALPGLPTTAAAADKLKWDQVEKRRTALQQELQLALTRSRELQQALAQKRVAY